MFYSEICRSTVLQKMLLLVVNINSHQETMNICVSKSHKKQIKLINQALDFWMFFNAMNLKKTQTSNLIYKVIMFKYVFININVCNSSIQLMK